MTSARFHRRDVLRFMLDARYRRDPYPLYDRLREAGDVQHTVAASTLVSSMDAALEVLRHPAMMSSSDFTDFSYRAGRLGAGLLIEAPFRFLLHRQGAGSRSDRPFALLSRGLLTSVDPPDHPRLRGLVSRAFTPRVVRDAGESIEKISHELVDSFEARGEVDLLTEFAYQLPIRVICSMLGIPAGDYPVFHDWVTALVVGFDLERTGSKAIMRRADAASLAIGAYLSELAEQRRREPRDDLLSTLVSDAEDGDRLSPDELVAMVVIILVAGHETTANLIANGVWSMHADPAQRDVWVDDPDGRPAAVEELLRYESPIQLVQRIAAEDVDIHGVPIPAGRIVIVLLGAANRDPAHFDAPHRLDLRRQDAHPIPFGFGAHHCIGASLARAEAQIGLAALYERLPGLRPVIDTPRWRSSIVFRGLNELPVTW